MVHNYWAVTSTGISRIMQCNSFCNHRAFFAFLMTELATRWVECSFLLTVTMRLWVQTPVGDFFLLFFSLFSLNLHQKPIVKHKRSIFNILLTLASINKSFMFSMSNQENTGNSEKSPYMFPNWFFM